MQPTPYIDAGFLPEYIARTFGVNLSPTTLNEYRREAPLLLPALKPVVDTWWNDHGSKIYVCRRQKMGQKHRSSPDLTDAPSI